jgi:hypothetical protein
MQNENVRKSSGLHHASAAVADQPPRLTGLHVATHYTQSIQETLDHSHTTNVRNNSELVPEICGRMSPQGWSSGRDFSGIFPAGFFKINPAPHRKPKIKSTIVPEIPN